MKVLFRLLKGIAIGVIISSILIIIAGLLFRASTPQDYGRIMIYYGCIYMLFGVAGTGLKNNHIRAQNTMELTYHGKKNTMINDLGEEKLSRNLRVVINSAIVGGIFITVGSILLK